MIVKKVNRMHLSSLSCHKDYLKCYLKVQLFSCHVMLFVLLLLHGGRNCNKRQGKASNQVQKLQSVPRIEPSMLLSRVQWVISFILSLQRMETVNYCTLQFRLWGLAFFRTEAEMQLFHPCKVMNSLPSGNQKWSEKMNCCAYVCQTLIPSCGQTHVVYESIFNSLSTGLCSSNWACIFH